MSVALACPLSAKRGCECFLLLRRRELSDQQSVTDGDLIFQEGFCHGRYQVSESKTTVDVRLALASARGDDGDGVGRFTEFQERFETQSFLQRVNVLPLQVLNALGLDGLGIRQFDDADRKFFEFRQLRRSEATCPGNNFVFAFPQFAY